MTLPSSSLRKFLQLCVRVCLHVCTCLSLGIHFLVGAWGGVRGLHAGWLGSVVHQLGSWGHLHRQGLAGREKSVHKQERRLYVVVLQLHRVAPYTESPYGPCSLHPTPLPPPPPPPPPPLPLHSLPRLRMLTGNKWREWLQLTRASDAGRVKQEEDVIVHPCLCKGSEERESELIQPRG